MRALECVVDIRDEEKFSGHTFSVLGRALDHAKQMTDSLGNKISSSRAERFISLSEPLELK
jgi:hypothetical protein